MKVAIDAREMVGSIAGKGRYVAELVKAIAVLDKTNTYYLYTKQPITVSLPENMQQVLIGGAPGLKQVWLALDAKKRDCDILFAPTGYLPLVFSLIPSVVTIHDLALFVTKDAKPALKTYIAETLLMRVAITKSKEIIAVSESTKNDLVKIFNIDPQKITVTPLGYDSTTYTPKNQGDETVLKEYKLSPDYLLFLGTLEPRKNIVGILHAYSQLSPELQAKHKLVIGGKKGWFYEEIFATVTALKLEKQVQFLGRVPDEHLPALYRQAKVFVFPSFYEGFGLPPLEALASGTPVISADNSSLPEVIGKGGLLVDPHNISALVDSMKTILTDKEVYKKLKEESVKQAAKFSWSATAQATLSVFAQAVKR